MFEDKLKADINKLSPSEETKSAVLATLSKKPKIKYLKFSSVIAAALAVVLALGVFYNSYDNDNSKNVVNAVKVAKAMGVKTLALTGKNESLLSGLCDVTIKAPETETFKIQEYHLPIYHYLCAEIEKQLF